MKFLLEQLLKAHLLTNYSPEHIIFKDVAAIIVMVIVDRDSYMKKMKIDAVLSFSTLKMKWGWQS